MSKRILWILFFVVPLAIVTLAVWHAHHARPKGGVGKAQTKSTLLVQLELRKGITPGEIQNATNILIQERQMWSRFNGMAGDISIEFDGNDGERLSFMGNVSLHRIDLLSTADADIVTKYEMTISDKQDGWTVTTDGTLGDTTTTCQAPQASKTITNIAPSILHMLTFPHDMLVSLYRDNLNPRARYTFGDMLKIWEIWLPLHSDSPDSFTFFDPYLKYPEFTFTNGYISRWREVDRVGQDPYFEIVERTAIFFESPIESNGFYYPTVIRMTPAPIPWRYPAMSEGFLDRTKAVLPVDLHKKGQLSITLSNVSVTVK